VKRVLIYRLGSLGDTVAALPCLHLIARVFPQAERVLLTNFPIHAKAPAAAAVLGDSGLVQGYMRYTVGTRRLGELLRLALQIRRFRPDLLVYLMPPRSPQTLRRDRIFFRLAGVRRMVGLPSAEEMQYRFDAATGLYEGEAQRLARALVEMGEAHPEEIGNWNPLLNAAEQDAAARALGELVALPLIAVGPGTKMQANDWGRENWRALLGRLARRFPDHALVMVGAQEDAEFCAYVQQDWTGVKLNLAGKLSPRESAAVFARARVFIGVDSGPKHLAASVGTRCVCVFSARDLPGVWFPPGVGHEIVRHPMECGGCGLETCIEMKKKCILSVTVEEMEQAVVRVLG